MSWSPVLERSFADAHLVAIRLGDPVVDEYLAFAGARLRLNSWLAVAFDLKVFFSVVGKEPPAITTADVFAFIKSQRTPRFGAEVVRLEDREPPIGERVARGEARLVEIGEPRVVVVDPGDGRRGRVQRVALADEALDLLPECRTRV